MARPPNCRLIAREPGVGYFKPRGVPMHQLQQVQISLDELEALRLADLQGLYQEDAARQMRVSRPTFGRIIASARRKVAEALTSGHAIRIQGGAVMMLDKRTFECADCNHRWQEPRGTGRPAACPACGSKRFHRAVEERGPWRGQGRGHCRRGSARGTRQKQPNSQS
jgi:predicted DNA-binding protein (UPF0251 family)/DNA-directed RNA polymerase subunit RPC12/RpoP